RLTENRLDYSVANLSISGETTAGGRSRLPEALRRHQPALVVIALGANDGLRGLNPALMQANLAEIMRRAQAAGAKTLLLGMRIPPNYGKPYNDLFEAAFPAVAQQHGAAYVPFLLEGVGGHAELMQPDGLHPNAQAQPVLMQRVWDSLAPLL
ncbi:MAG: arylesterase, partial [Candidatus Methylumidiphilus sp.]